MMCRELNSKLISRRRPPALSDVEFPVGELPRAAGLALRRRNAAGAAATWPLQDGQDEGVAPTIRVEGERLPCPYDQVPRLLAPSVNRAELPDVREVQNPGGREGGAL
eukprot:5357812-Pyramimonas_sp.AAC.1